MTEILPIQRKALYIINQLINEYNFLHSPRVKLSLKSMSMRKPCKYEKMQRKLVSAMTGNPA